MRTPVPFPLSLLLLSLLLLTGGCDPGAERPASRLVASPPERPVVYSTNYPLAWAASSLGGAAIDVRFPAPESVDPVFWQPGLDVIAGYQAADLIVLNGAGYARWVANTSLPESRLVDTSLDFRDKLLPLDSGPLHSHGPEGDHSHGALAFTLWLDMSLFVRQLESVAEALNKLVPEQTVAIVDRLQALTDRLMVMDVELTELGLQLAGSPIIYSHPVYQYLDRRYEFNGRALHWEPGQLPTDQQWLQMQSLLQEHPARLMLWEAEPLVATRDQLARLGIEVVVFHPMGNQPPEGDFLSGMQDNIRRFKAMLMPEYRE